MAAPTAMPIDRALLTLTQWLSPAYPVGAFAYSHGLEALVDDGVVHNAESFGQWLDDVLTFGAGRTDGILLCAAYRAPDPDALDEIDVLARALAPSRERLMETDLQGAAFADVTDAIWPTNLHGKTYPVAVGAAAAAQKLPLNSTVLLYLQAFASNLTAAATRLAPLGQTEAQTILASRAPLLEDLAKAVLDLSLDDIGSSTFLADIASMRHETQYSRLFRT